MSKGCYEVLKNQLRVPFNLNSSFSSTMVKIRLQHKIEKFKAFVEKQSGRFIKVLRSDMGKEYTSNEFHKFCEDEGVERQLTVGYTPHQNGVSERKNQTVMEMAKTKLEETSEKCVFIGYSSMSKGYRLYNMKTNKMIISRDVVFDENASWNWEEDKIEEKTVPAILLQQNSAAENEQPAPCTPSSSSSPSSPISSSSSPSSTPIKLKDLNDIYARCNYCVVEPENFDKAIKDVWWNAIEKISAT
ncbi:unnamed protein product [Trifolium pratense]|uniref:Uncharacterized protein n=1 Tax=Trifolium pratense TaxID=57577 RepID=A0ACB0JFY3_TRIPR|nr:unnamed protein product [Trifolium pratense]